MQLSSSPSLGLASQYMSRNALIAVEGVKMPQDVHTMADEYWEIPEVLRVLRIYHSLYYTFDLKGKGEMGWEEASLMRGGRTVGGNRVPSARSDPSPPPLVQCSFLLSSLCVQGWV